ncbi:urea amidolyase family protein [Castellaniella sp.]|uniref:5-oxoprolinase subunit B/C family protein n=1 Tax=Castellaniella sp. TaxID=1955812 RepID=UPI002AFDE919|nr:urea amidolyase family protein [Castellaniella sp.]
MTSLRCLPAGDGAVLAELGSLDEILALFQALGTWPAGVDDVIPAARTLLVLFSPAVLPARDVAAWLRRVAEATETAAGPSGLGVNRGLEAAAGRRVEIPVRYAGEDLEAVASLLGLTRAELIERHTGSDYLAAFAGFAPGFVYLAGGDPCFHGIPRHTVPRVRVPGGSVAVAGDFSAVYPSDSPGGWQLLGETPWRMWDMERAEPALVQPGFRVRFRDLDAPGAAYSLPAVAGMKPPVSSDAADMAPHDESTTCEVLDAGLQTLIQDEGRPGLTRLGVSRSGALDRRSMRRANQLVGNPPGSPVLEHVLGGLRLRCGGRVVMAVTGATAPVVVTSASGIRLPAAAGHPIVLNEGDELRIGRVRAGVRCYVAVRGAWAVQPVLGSCATDILAGMGPAPLKRGDRVSIGHPVAAGGGADHAEPESGATDAPRAEDRVAFDVVLGPRDDWFDADTVRRLLTQDWVVTPQSNRVGMRLAGDEPLVRARQGELPSEGTVAGALQVPPSGQPVLFLADHPLTGGYPVIAVVLSAQLDRLAQVPVGARLRFNPVPDPLSSPAPE